MKTTLKTLTENSKIVTSSNGWKTLLVPCEGFSTAIAVKTSRNIDDCINHFENLKKTFPNKKY